MVALKLNQLELMILLPLRPFMGNLALQGNCARLNTCMKANR